MRVRADAVLVVGHPSRQSIIRVLIIDLNRDAGLWWAGNMEATRCVEDGSYIMFSSVDAQLATAERGQLPARRILAA